MSFQREGPDAPLNELDHNGCTPLMYAAMADSVTTLEILLHFAAKREMVIQAHKICINSSYCWLYRLIIWDEQQCTMHLCLGVLKH